jgi:hypothetical protein
MVMHFSQTAAPITSRKKQKHIKPVKSYAYNRSQQWAIFPHRGHSETSDDNFACVSWGNGMPQA